MSWLERLANAWRAPDSPPLENGQSVAGDPDRIAEVQSVLAEMRPLFEADAGDVDLVSIDEGWVVVRLRGACRSCHASDMTLHAALEPRLKQRLSWVAGVRAL